MERSLPVLGGGGGNWAFEVTLVALEGTTIEPGRLLTKLETGLEEGAEGIYSEAGGVRVLAEWWGELLNACEMFWFAAPAGE